MRNFKEKTIRLFAIILLWMVSLSALLGGIGFMLDRTGSGVGIPISYLEPKPFNDFLIPGILLFIFVGLVCGFAAITAMVRSMHCHKCIIAAGIILAVWILTHSFMVDDFNLLHYIYFMMALMIIWAGKRIYHKNHWTFVPPGGIPGRKK